MKTLKFKSTVEKDGEIHITGLPYKKGEDIELVFISKDESDKPFLTAKDLLDSDVIGMWEDRDDIESSTEYARLLRNKAQTRTFE